MAQTQEVGSVSFKMGADFELFLDGWESKNGGQLDITSSLMCTTWPIQAGVCSLTPGNLFQDHHLRPESVPGTSGNMEPAIRIDRTTCGLRIANRG